VAIYHSGFYRNSDILVQTEQNLEHGARRHILKTKKKTNYLTLVRRKTTIWGGGGNSKHFDMSDKRT
jgi:hypothetical protein